MKVNPLSFFSIFALLGFFAIIQGDASGPDLLPFGYLFYLVYIRIPMDELLMGHIKVAALWTFVFTILTMSVFAIVFEFATYSPALVEIGFWVAFTILHLAFNLILQVRLSTEK